MNILVLGHTGMLGSAISKFVETGGDSLVVQNRNQIDFTDTWDVEQIVKGMDLVINCIGSIPARKDVAKDMIIANTIIPLTASEACRRQGAKFVHISTDCVFSGNKSSNHRYSELDVTDAAFDVYGRSKALGEWCIETGATVIRTSFIGLQHGLLPWFVGEAALNAIEKRPIYGYEHSLWTGSTVWEAARGIIGIAKTDWHGKIVHLATEDVWSKYRVLCQLQTILGIVEPIIPKDTPYINRALLPTVTMRDLRDKEVMEELRQNFNPSFEPA